MNAHGGHGQYVRPDLGLLGIADLNEGQLARVDPHAAVHDVPLPVFGTGDNDVSDLQHVLTASGCGCACHSITMAVMAPERMSVATTARM